MKRLVFVAALALAGCTAALALAGCTAAVAPTNTDAVAKWTDPETGCVYLVYNDGGRFANNRVGSLSIRFRADGTADCPGGPIVSAGRVGEVE